MKRKIPVIVLLVVGLLASGINTSKAAQSQQFECARQCRQGYYECLFASGYHPYCDDLLDWCIEGCLQ